jgi:hypothetical protein
MTVTIILILLSLIGIAMATPTIQTNKDSLVNGGNDGLGNSVVIVYLGSKNTSYDIWINDGINEGRTIPTLSIEQENNVTPISYGHWKMITNDRGYDYIRFATTSQTSPGDYTFTVTDLSGSSPAASINITILSSIPMVNDTPTATQTPAEVIPTEEITAEIRETTTPTSVPTSISPQDLTTAPTPTIQSMSAPTITPSATPTIDYEARIAEDERRIAEAEEQIRKQNDLIYQIMKLLWLTE